MRATTLQYSVRYLQNLRAFERAVYLLSSECDWDEWLRGIPEQQKPGIMRQFERIQLAMKRRLESARKTYEASLK